MALILAGIWLASFLIGAGLTFLIHGREPASKERAARALVSAPREVTLRVPILETCEVCEGEGLVFTRRFGRVVCAECDGLGKVLA